MYWPKEGSEVYGPIQVELLDQRELATYTIRKMLIKHIKVRGVILNIFKWSSTITIHSVVRYIFGGSNIFCQHIHYAVPHKSIRHRGCARDQNLDLKFCEHIH